MQAHKLQLKILADAEVVAGGGAGVTPETFIPVLHGWIKNRVLAEMMIDVANYAHVPNGPGVVLIGHACDYFVDETGGRIGLLHSRKRSAPEPADRLADAFRRTLHAAALLEAEPALAGKLHFRANQLLFWINDRLAAPNTAATLAAVKPELDALCGRLFAGSFELTPAGGDPRGLFGVKIVSSDPADLTTLLGRLGGPPPPDRSLVT
jgi:hypothetical protein